MDVFEAIYQRRSVRLFQPKAIPDSVLNKVLDAARWAPSACNRQLWEFVVVTKDELKKRIAFEAGSGQEFLIKAPVLIVAFYDDTKERKEEKRRHKHDAIQSAAAAIQNMHLAAYALGLGSLWVCGIKRPEKLNEILRVPDNIRPVAITAFGYPAERPVAPFRRSKDSFVHYNQFSRLKESYENSIDPRDWPLEALKVFRGRICWYGGTIEPDRLLEKYNIGDRTYQYLIDKTLKYDRNNKSKILDILSFAGGFVLGLAKKRSSTDNIFIFELSEGNKEFISANAVKFGIKPPIVLLNKGDKIKIPGSDFDIVMCFFRLEKVPSPTELLSELIRVMKPGAKLILANELRGITFFSKIFKKYRLSNLHRGPNWIMGPERRYSKYQINRMLKRFSVTVIEQEIFRENSWIKATSKQVVRNKGVTLLTIVEKK